MRATIFFDSSKIRTKSQKKIENANPAQAHRVSSHLLCVYHCFQTNFTAQWYIDAGSDSKRRDKTEEDN
jgi:hypothetical protein